MKASAFVIALASTVLCAEGINEVFSKGKASGELRLCYIDQSNEDDVDTYGSSLGGILKFETASFNDFSLGLGAYVSQKIGFASGSGEKTNPDFFDQYRSSFAYLGEAYLNYAAGDLSVRVGRQLLDTPLDDRDDIRMLPNTFEGAVATYNAAEQLVFTAAYLQRWAGYDSADDISKFKRLDGVDSNGAALAGIQSEQIENLALQGWYYSMDNIADAFYADAIYSMKIDVLQVDLGGEYVHFSQDNSSGVDGDVYGIEASLTYEMLNFAMAYNWSHNEDGTSPSNGLGGGPYFTSMEEWTINGMEDVRAYQLNGTIELEQAGLKGLAFSVMYGNFESKPSDMKVHETDLIVSYIMSDNLNAYASYAMIDDNAHTGYDRILARVMYRF